MIPAMLLMMVFAITFILAAILALGVLWLMDKFNL